MKVGTLIEADGSKISCPNASSQMSYFEQLLKDNGIERATTPEEADYIVYSSCGFDGKTLEQVSDTIKSLAGLQMWNGVHYKLIIVGCITKLLNGMDGLNEDVVFIRDDIWSKATLDYILNREKNITVNDMLASKIKTYCYGNEVFISADIVDGCINKCSFCKNNYMKNDVTSIPYDELLSYLKQKIANGTRFIDFHGETLNIYGIDLYGKPILHNLLHELEKEKELVGISLGEITIQNMYKELLEEIQRNSKIRNLTLQLESGSNEILKSMDRGHTIEKYEDIASSIINSGKFVDTVLMSGYPGETYHDLDLTLDYIKKSRIPVYKICQYVDADLLPSHKLEQLSYDEKIKHTKYLREVLKPLNVEIYKDNIWRMGNAVIYGKKDNVVIAVGGTTLFAYSDKEKHRKLELGSIIEEPPKMFVKKSKIVKNSIYRY